MEDKSIKKLKLTVLVEDTSPKRPFCGEHGLSIWIEADDKKILFDTGFSGKTLIHNLSVLNIDITKIDAFVLSHPHDDHSGGLNSISDFIKDKKIYCVSNAFYEDIPNGNELIKKMTDINYVTEKNEIFSGIMISQQRDTINTPKKTKEINLVINLENKGLVIIVGCSHHGLDNLIQDALNSFDKQIPLYALVGGLHFKDNSVEEINKNLDNLKKYNFKIIAPNHCTGFNALKIITDKFAKETELIRHTDTGTFHTGLSLEL